MIYIYIYTHYILYPICIQITGVSSADSSVPHPIGTPSYTTFIRPNGVSHRKGVPHLPTLPLDGILYVCICIYIYACYCTFRYIYIHTYGLRYMALTYSFWIYTHTLPVFLAPTCQRWNPQRCDDASFVVGWRNVGSHLGLTWSLHESTCRPTSGRFDEGEGEDDGLKVSVVAYLSLNPSDYILPYALAACNYFAGTLRGLGCHVFFMQHLLKIYHPIQVTSRHPIFFQNEI